MIHEFAVCDGCGTREQITPTTCMGWVRLTVEPIISDARLRIAPYELHLCSPCMVKIERGGLK